MARVAGSFQSYDAKGNREDLADIIYNISPVDTPIMSAAQRRSVHNTQFDWQTDALAAPSVVVAKPQVGEPSEEIVLPGNIEAYTDSGIYARTDGYLQKWYFDIGARVRRGQLLAVSPTVASHLGPTQAQDESARSILAIRSAASLATSSYTLV